MSCFRPLYGYRSNTVNPESGKRSIVFSIREGFHDLPVTVPCGQCTGCRLERSRVWAIRCLHEASLHSRSCFITLTYSDSHIPFWYSDSGPIPGNLQLSDFQDFLKRLRKRYGSFRYFHCGEYGERFGRPHYHALIFGLDFSDKKLWKQSGDHPLYVSKKLDRIWGKGHCIIGNVSFDSAAYVARYCLKKVTGRDADSHYQGRTPEYTTMSRRPGIGAEWFRKWSSDVYPSDSIIISGREMRPPKFYDSLFELDSPSEYAKVKAARKVALSEFDPCGSEQTPRRLRDKETVAISRLSQLKRSYEYGD